MTKTLHAMQTPDGVCTTATFRPAGEGPFPAVIVYMDGLGIRPAVYEIGERLAQHGYYAMVPDVFYRSGAYEAPDPRTLFLEENRPQLMAWMGRHRAHLNRAAFQRDAGAFIAFLRAQPEVRRGPIGATGYCMGGGIALTAAASFPDDVRAVAAYHPGNLATDDPESPHNLATAVKATVYIGRAKNDRSFPDEMEARLHTALSDAGVQHTIERYDAQHGWVLADTPVHDPAATERHWVTLLALLDGAIK